MDIFNRKKLIAALKNLRVKGVQLISSYQEGYIGKKVYKVTLNDGSTRLCEQILKNKRNGDAVVIIPITEDGNFVMVVESRPNTSETVVVEFPAGMVDKGESPLDAAKRELLEETGYVASNIYELEWHYQDQGCSKAIIRTYIAEGVKKVQDKKLDADEKLEFVEMSYHDILNMLKSPKDRKMGQDIDSELINDLSIRDANSKIGFMEYVLKKRGLL